MKRYTCRACGSNRLRLVYDFGPQPLAGEFPLVPETKQEARRYPLDLSQCETCGLLQVSNLPPIDAIFHDDYRYSSSTVTYLVNHFSAYAEWLAQRIPKGSSVLEFGCNDGILLSRLQKKGFSCVGIDASDNVAEIARKQGVNVHTAFMSEALIREYGLEGRHDLVTCSNVLAHIDDIHSTLSAVRSALKPNGLFAIEVHDAVALVREAQFETVYHEHLSYFTELTLRRLVESHGFAFLECSITPMHGGALRLICRRQEDGFDIAPPMDDIERVDGSHFSSVIKRCSEDVRLASRQYGLLDGFGAAGRAQMFVNISETRDCFAQVFDDSMFRQNRFMVGTDIPIRKFGEKHGRACVILAWNYAPLIAERIRSQYDEVLTVLPQKKSW